MFARDTQQLLQDGHAPEPFVRRGLALLESTFRRGALLALADWDRLGLPSNEIFGALAALQRPSWGSWNELLAGLRRARRAVLAKGSPVERTAVEGADRLARRLAAHHEPLDAGTATTLRPLMVLVRRPDPGRALTLGDVHTLPITLRNRVVHDQPTDPGWWQAAADALRPLLVLHGRLIQLQDDASEQFPAPWFREARGELWEWNGLTADFQVVYVSSTTTETTTDNAGAVLQAFKRLLGKTDAQERDVRQLLTKLVPEELRGVLLGDLLVGRPIGEGAFATVHQGRQLSTGRRVAVKVLADGVGEDDRARFKQEAAFLSRFSHVNIVGVLGFGEEVWSAPREPEIARSLTDQAWFRSFSRVHVKAYMALEWVDGQTLDQVFLSANRPAVRTLVSWFLQAAEALAVVHAAGLIHRDVKPQNLMVSGAGDKATVKLMDFGIARSEAADRTHRTEKGVALGTRSYMSPEQLRARDAVDEVGPASDVYGLTATFYELITQTRLYEHDHRTAEAFATRKLAGEPPTRPRSVVRGLPWEVETLLLGGLESEPTDRYTTAAELADDIRRFLADEPLKKKRPSAWRQARLAYRRNRTIVSVVALATLALSGSLIAYAISLRGKNADILGEREEARRAQARAQASEAEARRRLSAQSEELARQRLASGEYLGSLPFLRDALEAGGAGLALRFMVSQARRALGAVRATLVGHRSPIEHIVFSPRGNRLVSADTAGELRFWDLAAGASCDQVAIGPYLSSVRWDPGGTRVLVSTGTGVFVYDFMGRKLGQIFEMGLKDANWSPDGRWIATASANGGGVRIWTPDADSTGFNLQLGTLGGGPVVLVAWSPDGAWLAAGHEDGVIQVWEPAARKRLATLRPSGRGRWMAWVGNDRLLTFGSDLEVWSAPTWARLASVRVTGTHVSVSPDGRSLAVTGGSFRRKAGEVWEIASGRRTAVFGTEESEFAEVAWAMGGSWVVTARGRGGAHRVLGSSQWQAAGATRQPLGAGHDVGGKL